MATAPTDVIRSRDGDPNWYRVQLGWRVAMAVAIAVGLVSAVIRRGIETEGPLRLAVVGFLLAALLASLAALRGVARRAHFGRLTGFVIDLLMAVILGFVAVNRMGLFTGLDAVGEAFNQSFAWGGVIVLGWLVAGLARSEDDKPRGLAVVGRWTMIAGAVALALAMGVLPGLLELGKRLFQPEVLPVAMLAVVAGGSARLLWSDSAARFFRTTQNQNEVMDGILFVTPNALGFLAFFAGPLAVSLFISFTDWDGLTNATFVGLQNYVDLFSDELFLRSLRNIVVFGIVAIPLAVLPALLLAALLNSKLRGMKVFRAIYFLPSIAGVVGVTLIWKQLFNSTVGYVNYAILQLTNLVNSIFGSAVEAPQPQWISDSGIALISVIILFVWQQTGFNTVLFLAGMRGIDKTLYEAAEIDGAGPWKQLVNITVPMLRPTTVFVVATTTILALQIFNEPFILQAPSPPAGPGNATLTPVVYLYQNAFQQFQIGYASAVAWVLFLLIFGITILYFRRSGDDRVLGT